MEFLQIVLFAGAVSLDGLMVGMAYGVRKIRVPLLSQVVIVVASGAAVLSAMLVGKLLGQMVDAAAAHRVGSLLLLLLGLFFLLQGLREYLCARRKNAAEPLLSFQVRPLGIVIHILEAPESADRNADSRISWREACVLGLALSLDSFGAGVGIALRGFSVGITVLSVLLINLLTMKLGLYFGKKAAIGTGCGQTSFLTGGLFLLLVLIQLL